MRKFSVIILFTLISSAAVVSLPLTAAAATRSYDPYEDNVDYALARAKAKPTTSEKIGEFPALPFDLAKGGIEKAFVFVEKYHIDTKVIRAYENLTKHGIYPKLHGFGGHDAGFGGGVEINRNIFAAKPIFEVLNLDGWAYESVRNYQEYGSRAVLGNVLSTGVNLNAGIDYRNFAKEDFYGLGPRTSRGDAVNFRFEDTTATTGAERDLPFDFSTDVIFGYSHTKILDGTDDNPEIKKYYTEQTLPGRDGGDRIFLDCGIMHDTRDDEQDPRSGGFQTFRFGYYDSFPGKRFKYVKYKAEAAHFIPIFSKKRVLAIRFLGELNDSCDNRHIPFYDMARMGGFYTLRGYRFNRYFDEGMMLMNFEYRYQIWKYKDFSADAVPFFEMGQVFPEISKMRGSYMRFSYGFGFRAKYKNKSVGFEAANSSEGLELYLGMGVPF
ncbi:MAG: BamA/TamA family outer membrane protein [Candidatus Omnitrophica bacterium]|nr:BamA/TamA family outer membrane protein [Candidatus Omnitrophota bacterium]